MLNTGKATPEQIRGWVANRFYYQIAIPVKDAAILSNCPDRDVRRQLDPAHPRPRRLRNHRPDGRRGRHRSLAAPRREATGLKREEIVDLRHVMPGVRFAVDAYINFAASVRGRKRCARR
jgi:pyrroloquinoline-quinone synthase